MYLGLYKSNQAGKPGKPLLSPLDSWRPPTPTNLTFNLEEKSMKKVFAFLVLTGLCATLMVTSPVPSAAKKDKLRKSQNKIENNYIVVLDNAVVGEEGAYSIAPYIAEELAATHKGKLKQVYKNALNGFAVEMSPEDAERLSEDFRVAFVEEDAVVTADATQSNPPWGLDRIDQRSRPLNAIYTFNWTGAGVFAYVIDTGIRTAHTQFGGRAANVFDAFGGNGQDCNGHGTHVAGTIGGSTFGVAKSVNLRGVRVLNCSGSGTNSGVIAGVDFVRLNRQNPAVANMSLGGGASGARRARSTRRSITSRIREYRSPWPRATATLTRATRHRLARPTQSRLARRRPLTLARRSQTSVRVWISSHQAPASCRRGSLPTRQPPP
jgi:hypothetical protein